MKIEDPQWMGKKLLCSKCGCLFLLDGNDEEKVHFVKSEDVPPAIDKIVFNKITYQINCPKCSEEISFEIVISLI